jgi:hypothetical protein
MSANSNPDDWVSRARFIFTGTVEETRKTTMSIVPPSEHSIVVKVDGVFQSPPMFSGYAGKRVTVQLSVGSKLKAGDSMVFYTTGWLYGEGIAVHAVGYASATTVTASKGRHPSRPTQRLREKELDAQLARADVVVAGKVLTTKEAELEPRSGGVSHKNPKWREAVIQVEALLKGSLPHQEIVVIFPSSTDVRWHAAPKFSVGQRGIWMLNQDLGQHYTALHPLAFQTTDEMDKVKAALERSKLHDRR